jgi:plasmid maintenance system antidote protein VapI
MTENERILEWMKTRNIGNSDLATAMGISYDLAYKVTTGQRIITDAFKWQFQQAYGYEEATRLFTQPTEVTA